MATHQLGWLTAILFHCCSLDLLSFSFYFCLISEVATCSMATQIYKIWSEMWVSPEIWRPKNIVILWRFHTTLRLDCECLRNPRRHDQSENSIANYGHSHIGIPNSVYKRATNGKKIVLKLRPTQRLGNATHLVHSFIHSFQKQRCIEKRTDR